MIFTLIKPVYLDSGIVINNIHTILKKIGFKRFRSLSEKEYEWRTEQLTLYGWLLTNGDYAYTHFTKNIDKGIRQSSWKIGDSLFLKNPSLDETRIRYDQYIYIGEKKWQKN